jgi:hypothetical protein
MMDPAVTAFIADIERFTGRPLAPGVRRYAEDRLLSVLCDTLSLSLDADDPIVLAVVRANADWNVLDDNPDAREAMGRVAYQFDHLADRAAERIYNI